MTTAHDRRAANRLLLGGYAPLVALLVTVGLLVALVPSKAPERREVGLSTSAGAGDALSPGSPGEDAGAPGAGAVAPDGSGGTGGADAGTAAGGTGAGGAGRTGAPPAAPAGAVVELGTGCEGGERQTREPYSPPCITFSGDNGGATSLGVTGDTITITNRLGDLPSIYAVAGAVAEKANIKDTPEDISRTINAYVDYFNKKFQLYGRKVKLVEYKGQGDQLSEFFGAGAEAANADALRVAQEIKGFADISALTVPYAEALIRQKVIAIPPVHMSRQWYEKHAPYSYGVLVDCSRLADTLVEWFATRVAPFNARYAGDPAFRERKRSIGVIIPENPWYQECMNDAKPKLKARGVELGHQINYVLDFNRLSGDASGMIAQMKERGVTTVTCLCDPVLPLFLTTQATQQEYRPEWVITGTALTDVDLLGQIYDVEQWRHAFGISFLSDIYSGVRSESYRAYKAVRDDEPAFIHDVLYYPILLTFLGIHMAGPNLTPETFEDGLFRYPPTVGETGLWSFGPGDRTSTDDAREVYWDGTAVSPFNGSPGRWITTLDGARFTNKWPEGEAIFPITP